MKPDLQRRIQRYGWDKAAPNYEIGWEEQLWPTQERLLSTGDLEPGEEVLDVSCGTGLVTFPVAEIIQPGGYILATDLSDGMIENIHAQVNARKMNNIACKQMEAEDLALPDNIFDVVICCLGLMYFPNQACVAAFLGGAVALAYQKFDEKTKKEVHREYLDSIRQYRRSKAYDVPGEFVITGGIKPDYARQ